MKSNPDGEEVAGDCLQACLDSSTVLDNNTPLPLKKGGSMKAWKIEIFKNKRGKVQFHLKSANGRVIMHSEEYSSHSKARKTVDAYTHTTEVTVEDLCKK